MSAMTLCLDRAWKPYNLIPVKDAVSALVESMLARDGAVEAYKVDEGRRFRNASRTVDMPAPLVIVRYDYLAPTHKELARFSKRVMFARDKFECQYCGHRASPRNVFKELTVDHVKPQRLFATKADATRYENCTSACRRCNQRKGGKLPYEAHMMPRTTPKTPTLVQLKFGGRRLHDEQRDYIATYFGCDPTEIS
jgi:5-methylcytosine-specific restriction endonuclease McrA